MPITPPPDAEVRDELHRAFATLRPSMIEHARRDADLDPDRRADDFSDADLEQFLNAYEALFFEALDGRGRAKRDIILDTALPPVLAMGSTALDIVRGNVVTSVMSTYRLLALVAEGRREAAARWLAVFFADYTRELAERAITLEREQR